MAQYFCSNLRHAFKGVLPLMSRPWRGRRIWFHFRMGALPFDSAPFLAGQIRFMVPPIAVMLPSRWSGSSLRPLKRFLTTFWSHDDSDLSNLFERASLQQ